MNVLFLTPRLPYPPVQGDRVRAYRLLKHLSREHTITLVTFIERESDKDYLSEVRGICSRLHVVLLSPWRSYVNCGINAWRDIPLQVAYYSSRQYRNLVESILAESKYDLIHTHLLRMAPYTNHIHTIPKVLDMTDAISLYLSRYAAGEKRCLRRKVIELEKKRIVNFEKKLNHYDRILVCSEKDSAYLKETHGFEKLEVIYNCINVPSIDQNAAVTPIPYSLIFSGNFDYPPNADAANYLVDTLFPQILAKVPEAKLLIVGKNPPRSVRKKQSSNITVTGYVEDMNIWYRKATIAVSPVRFGAGTLNKVLEPMAVGKLVVATPIGVEGLNLENEKDILLSYSDDEFVAKTVRALQNESLRMRVGENARQTVMERFNCEKIARKVSNIYEEVVQSFQRT